MSIALENKVRELIARVEKLERENVDLKRELADLKGAILGPSKPEKRRA